MATKKKLLQAAAGSAGGAGLNVEEVFSTYVYDGSSGTQLITNGIDLSGEGGLTWFKRRNGAGDHQLFDSERTGRYRLEANTTDAQVDEGATVWNTQSTGFYIGGDGGSQIYNSNGDEYVSWTFRKAPKFFDVVTYTGNGTAGRTVSHDLGTTVGTIIVKRTDSARSWYVFHRSVGSTKYLALNETDAAITSSSYWNDTDPTSTEFTLGSQNGVNASGGTYVAYLFAHNDGDGDFGDGTQDIIKCGSYTGNGSTDGPEIDLGFEPQWLLVKNASATGGWQLMDAMRGMVVGGDDGRLEPNTSSAEATPAFVNPQPTGFQVTSTGSNMNTNGATYIYIAIRRGPMAVPEDATDVFDPTTGVSSGTKVSTDFPVDFQLIKDGRTSSGSIRAVSRLTGVDTTSNFTDFQSAKFLYTAATSAESSSGTITNAWDNTGFEVAAAYGTNTMHWSWRRAPSFCDVVAYTGDGATNHTISHNLGVAPEMIWIKNRGDSTNWPVYHSGLTSAKMLRLNQTGAEFNMGTIWGNQTFDASGFTVGSTSDETNKVNNNYIAYLFASLAGVSKVGGITGNGSASGDSQTIDCGFTSGARFVLIKRTSGPGGWYVWDSERGIVAGNDPFLTLSNTNAENTSVDLIDPTSSGFIFNYDNGWMTNISGNTYIFYAIA